LEASWTVERIRHVVGLSMLGHDMNTAMITTYDLCEYK
jgi:hypothetical protein